VHHGDLTRGYTELDQLLTGGFGDRDVVAAPVGAYGE